jgi:hypothetical protein
MNDPFVPYLRQVPAVLLHGNLVWFVDEFLLNYAVGMATIVSKKNVQAAVACRSALLQQKTGSVSRDGVAYAMQVCSWAAKLEDLVKVPLTSLKVDDIKRASTVIVQVS